LHGVAAGSRFRLTISAVTGSRYAPFLRKHLRAAHRLVRPRLGELSVALVGDRRMSELHEQFMGVAGPTDVLTFPLDLDARGRPVSGEVIVCVPEARRQAKARKVPVERELLLYALHGLLHLCGYDDRTDASFRAMHRTEDEILTRLGVGPVFAPAGAAPPPKTTAGRRATLGPGRRAARRSPRAPGGGAH
jgi:probable rRNA maturation factor